MYGPYAKNISVEFTKSGKQVTVGFGACEVHAPLLDLSSVSILSCGVCFPFRRSTASTEGCHQVKAAISMILSCREMEGLSSWKLLLSLGVGGGFPERRLAAKAFWMASVSWNFLLQNFKLEYFDAFWLIAFFISQSDDGGGGDDNGDSGGFIFCCLSL